MEGNEEEEFEEPEDTPRKVAKRMSIEQLDELMHRYDSRSLRMEKLDHLEADLQENMTRQKQRATELTERLQATKAEIEQLASARQVYEEIDNKNASLSTARKEADEYKDNRSN